MSNYTVQKLIDLYRSDKTPAMIYKMEENGLIPTAQRRKHGFHDRRYWGASDLPTIGSKIGFLDSKKITECKVLCFYFPKGGIGKTTNAINFARVFAINGIRTLYIELDKTNSGSSILSKDVVFEHPNVGINEVVRSKLGLDQIIHHTELPTLDYIPAVPNLIDLEYRLQTMTLPQFVLRKALEPLKRFYKIIIIDNPSNFGLLVQNALSFCTHLIAPLQCEAVCHQSLIDNISTLNRYREDTRDMWNTIYLRTMLGDDNDSKAICGDYEEILGGGVCAHPIRRSVIASSAYLARQSILEYMPKRSKDGKTTIADDYYNVICDVYGIVARGI